MSRNECFESVKKEIKEILWEVWKLFEIERRKVLKCLFF